MWVTHKYNLRKKNFKGDVIPAIGGLVFVLAGIFFYCTEWLIMGTAVASAAAYLLVTLTFGLLGIADDIIGDRSTGGFKGHFNALRNGKFTTGMAKVIGGGFASLVAGFILFYPHILNGLMAALIIALSANLINLLDVRPGRCLIGFLTGALIVIINLAAMHLLNIGFLFYFAVAIALILYPLDALGVIMIGDTGANAFGAVLGVSIVLMFTPVCQVIVLILLVGFHFWSETHSLTRTIEKNKFLSSLDRKIGIR